MDKHIIKRTAERLNIYDEAVIKKTEEYLRLYQSKASVKSLNDQAKTVLCLDLASHSLGKGFDKDVALSLCGFKKSVYQNNLNTIEKVLGIDRTLTVSDVCVQLGCTVIKEDAENILAKYKQKDDKIKDLDHPQYVAVATYMACKNKNVPVDKSKLVTISHIKSSQWKELLSEFEKLGLGKKSVKQKTKENIENEDNEIIENQPLKKECVEEIEEYEVWKKRILKEAYAALEQEKREESCIIVD